MAQPSSLMEWIEQTKKLAKAVDYVCIDTVDSIVTCIPLLHKSVINQHREFFLYFCELYHKPNPVDLIKGLLDFELNQFPCLDCAKGKTCKSILAEYVESSLKRCKRLIEAITWQWFEVIDFMFERPELVNPAIIDEYVRQQIDDVCKNHKKNNPFKNGFDKKFGKFWKCKNGRWKAERRKRF